MDPQATTMGTAIIFTTRMEALARFYQDGLGLGPYQTSPNHMGQQVGDLYLGFDQVDPVTQGSSGSRDLGVSLWFTVGDIEATFERLVALGAEVRYPPTEKPHVGYLASVYDLDGNILGLAQRRPG